MNNKNRTFGSFPVKSCVYKQEVYIEIRKRKGCFAP